MRSSRAEDALWRPSDTRPTLIRHLPVVSVENALLIAIIILSLLLHHLPVVAVEDALLIAILPRECHDHKHSPPEREQNQQHVAAKGRNMQC